MNIQHGNDISLQIDEPFYRKKPFKFTFLPPQELKKNGTPGKGPAHQNCRKVVSPWPHTTHCPRIATEERHSMDTFFYSGMSLKHAYKQKRKESLLQINPPPPGVEREKEGLSH